jgi:thiol-disulfide isomerase/thioredoxin
MFTSVDLRFQTALASHLPSFLTNPTHGLERSSAVEDRLASLRGKPRFDATATAAASDAALSGVRTPKLPVLGHAPNFTNTQRWFNSSPLTMAALRGRVVLVDFWTYTCINCVATLPYLRAWDERYRGEGLTIVGVHTPEFAFEKSAANVADAIRSHGLGYPVVQDNEYGTWNAFGNQYWPAKYLIDATGEVRYTHFGEGDYEETEAAIRALLAEAGRRRLGRAARARGELMTPGREATPETYLGAAKAQGFSPAGPRAGTHDYALAGPRSLPRSVFSLGGRWAVDDESARAVRGATLRARVVAKGVFLVLSSKDGRPRRVRVFLDGAPVSAAQAGSDVHGGVLTVRRQRLYHLVRLRRTEDHVLTLRVGRDVSGYAFTFR